MTEFPQIVELDINPLMTYDQGRGAVALDTKDGSSGESFVLGAGEVPIWRLDDFGDVGRVDFVKVDCVGYELPALRGMERLLLAHRPCVCVEQKPGYAQRFGYAETGAVDYLKSLGAVERMNMSGVYVLNWEEHD